MIYFDNAATSWPKPEAVYKAMDHCMRQIGANPGRSGHKLSVEAERVILNARDALAELLAVSDSSRIIFAFNATDALNLGIKCILRPGDHVITTSFEHNSVIRPLRHLERSGRIELTVVGCTPEGFLEAKDIEREIRPATRLVAITHASNVTGTLMPVAEVGDILEKYDQVFYLIDAAQTIGIIPMTADELKADMIAFPGHKGLLGPQGTGGLYLREGLEEIMPSLKEGGTGSLSEKEYHPDFLPDKYESGTKNTPGLAGLGAAMEFLEQTGIEKIHRHEQNLTGRLLAGLEGIEKVNIYGPKDPGRQMAVVSINIDGLLSNEVGFMLDQEYEIMTRVGLHCAPLAHRTIGTAPSGTVRLSMGCFNTPDEVDYVCRAVREIAKKSAV